MITAIDIAWVAGIIEGEGWIGHDKRSVTPKIKVQMTDENVIRRLHKITNVGVVGNPSILPSGKKCWTWRVERPNQSTGLLMTIASFLGERRFNKAKETLLLWINNKRIGSRSRRTVCIRGHSLLDINNLGKITKRPLARKCKECARIRSRAYKEKLRRGG